MITSLNGAIGFRAPPQRTTKAGGATKFTHNKTTIRDRRAAHGLDSGGATIPAARRGTTILSLMRGLAKTNSNSRRMNVDSAEVEEHGCFINILYQGTQLDDFWYMHSSYNTVLLYRGILSKAVF